MKSGISCLLFVVLACHLNNLVINEVQPWNNWSLCSKSCDIGTRTRRTNNGTSTTVQTQFCNLQYCPDIKKTCSSRLGCDFAIPDGAGVCVNDTCYCRLGDGYNKYNCLPEFGNCTIRVDPPTALGFKDPEVATPNSYKLYSCTTNDNTKNEVHIIGIYGDRYKNKYQVTVLPRGPVNKPVILVLTSYETTIWKINTSVDLKEVLYGGYNSYSSTVEPAATSKCRFKATRRRDLRSADGSDTGGGDTIQVMKTVSSEYGPITSFTGYYQLSSSPISHIILKVGGNPLSYVPKDFVYNLTMVNCTSEDKMCLYTNTSTKSTSGISVGYSWGMWTPCSKTCDIGTKIREKCNSTGRLIEREEQFCNLHYCPDIWKSCNGSSGLDCFGSIPDGRSDCVNNRCQCTMGDNYNKYNCYPEYGNCIIHVDPPTALGYKDPKVPTPYRSKLYSCTADDNTENEVHVIGIYGDTYRNKYQVTVLPRGRVNKPIILVLTSYRPTFWKINTSVELQEVVYSGYRYNGVISTVEIASYSRCSVRTTKRGYFPYAFGSDTGGGNTIQVLRNISAKYGPVTSFTGYYQLSSFPMSHIILQVGGNPLSYVPKDFVYDVSKINCTLGKSASTFSSNSSSNGTIEIIPSEDIRINEGGHLTLQCHYHSRAELGGGSNIELLDRNYSPVSNGFTVNKDVYNNDLYLLAEKNGVYVYDSGVYTCVETKSRMYAKVSVYVISVIRPEPWTTWHACTKSCDIGKTSRERCDSSGCTVQTKYCNLQYCPDTWDTCSSPVDCFVTDGYGDCINGRCHCTMGDGYNRHNCHPEFGNCVIRINPPTALGFRDPTGNYSVTPTLYSCTTNDNSVYEVHIIGIHGRRHRNKYKITVLPRGPVTKPIVLVLTSYETTHWFIDTSVALYKVFFGGHNSHSSTVQRFSSSRCGFHPIKQSDLPYAYGSDSGNPTSDTLQVMRTISSYYGPITSFTGYYELSTLPMSHIILKVGADPLDDVWREYVYNISIVSCIPVEPVEYITLQHFVTQNVSNIRSTRRVSTAANPQGSLSSNLSAIVIIFGIIFPILIVLALLIIVSLCCLHHIRSRRSRISMQNMNPIYKGDIKDDEGGI